MSCYWNKYTDEDPTHQWLEDRSFELEKILYLKQILKSSHNKQLPRWYLWKERAKIKEPIGCKFSLSSHMYSPLPPTPCPQSSRKSFGSLGPWSK